MKLQLFKAIEEAREQRRAVYPPFIEVDREVSNTRKLGGIDVSIYSIKATIGQSTILSHELMRDPAAFQKAIDRIEGGIAEQVFGEVKKELLDIMHQLYTRSHNETFMKLGQLYDLMCGKDS